MKAILFRKYGAVDVLQIETIAPDQVQNNEVQIKVCAVEATKGDCELRSFNFSVKWFWVPLRLFWGILKPKKNILGAYFSGEVISVGKGVSKFSVGDKIYGSSGLKMSAYAQYLCLPETYTMAAKPKNLSFEEAAGVPLGGLNAIHFMKKANIKKGEKVLIIGAGGSIGIFAIQIAKSLGAQVSAVDHSNKEAMIRKIGVDHYFSYDKEDIVKRGQFYDVIFTMVPSSPYSKHIKMLNPNGRYLLGNPRLSAMLKSIVTNRLSHKTVVFEFAKEKIEELVELTNLIEANKIRPIIDNCYSMEQVNLAHERVETEQRLGIVIINISSADA